MALTDRQELRVLLQDVGELRQDLVDAEDRQRAAIGAVEHYHRYSARNLVHYVELRRHDVRDLQTRLATHGLTSLGRTESHVLAGVDGLLHTLSLLVAEREEEWTIPRPLNVPDGPELLARNAATSSARNLRVDRLASWSRCRVKPAPIPRSWAA